MSELHPKQQKTAKLVDQKVTEWIAKGVEVKKIKNAIWNNWGAISQIKDGTFVVAMMASVSDGRGGRKTGKQVVIGTYQI